MLIEIGDKLISTEIFKRKFVCDLNACKGACCVEGDNGAPLSIEEVNLLEENIDVIKPFMRPEGISEVEKNGVFYIDGENEPVTALVNGAECAFVFFDEHGVAKCAVEQAFNHNKTTFKKPISCHLYPIRVKQFNEFKAINYDSWGICSSACLCGSKLDISVYRFLKEPIIRAFGETFFEELEQIELEIEQNPFG